MAIVDNAALVGEAGSVRSLAETIRRGATSARSVVEAYLQRIAAVDGKVHAFISVDADGALETAAARDAEVAAGRAPGPLHGVPFAVKDVIDVAGLPTRAGSRARADAPPAVIDATMVARLKGAGAIFLGKVHTTEFAFFDGIPPVRNPHDLSRTPGGSSGGSAAAVAAGMAPFALGTQTAGSVNRPAAFCGIGAFKPTTLAMGGIGVTPFAPSFDTIGILAGTAADAAYVTATVAPSEFLGTPHTTGSAGAAVFLSDPLIEERAEPSMKAALSEVRAQLAASGVAVRDIAAPVPLADIVATHRVMMIYELGRIHARLLERPDLIGATLAETIAEGQTVSEAAYLDAVGTLARMRRQTFEAVPPPAMLVLPAAPGPAPVGEATGDPVFVTVATALSGPTATISAGPCSQTGMPLGALVSMAPGSDPILAHRLMAAPAGSPLAA